MGLTRDDLRTLRAANDAVCFHWLPSNTSSSRSVIVAHKRWDAGDGFGPQTATAEIVINDPIWSIYERNGDTGRALPQSCFASARSTKINPEWQTVLHFLRAGDELVPEWVGGNTNKLTRKAGLAYDEFKLRVRRPRKNGSPLNFAFILDHMIYPIDSPARMVQL